MAVRDRRATDTWSLAEAKAKFSEVVERARHEGPQRVTKNGRDAVVVVSAEEWADSNGTRQRQHKETVFDVLQRAHLDADELIISPRRAERLREIDW